MALARRRCGLAQGQAAQAPLRHPADHPGIPGGAAAAPPRRGGPPVRRSALHRHRRGPLAATRRSRRPDPVPHRAPEQARRRQPAAHRAVRHHRRPRALRRLSLRRHRTTLHHPPFRGTPAHLAPVHGALLSERTAGHRARPRTGGWHAGSRGACREAHRGERPLVGAAACAGGAATGGKPGTRQGRSRRGSRCRHRRQPPRPRRHHRRGARRPRAVGAHGYRTARGRPGSCLHLRAHARPQVPGVRQLTRGGRGRLHDAAQLLRGAARARPLSHPSRQPLGVVSPGCRGDHARRGAGAHHR